MPEKKSESTKDALIIFVDIRGFTNWSTANESFEYAPELVTSFYSSIRKPNNFQRYSFKSLGDGAMLVHEVELKTQNAFQKELVQALKKIDRINFDFQRLCDRFAAAHGHATPLKLGWGVTRGPIKKICQEGESDDYLGSNINKSSRLCDIARPCGIVLDKEDFPNLPVDIRDKFFPQVRKIESIGNNVEVWVTEEIQAHFYRRELLRETPEVHVSGLCIRNDHEGLRLFLAERSAERELFPSLYEGCGGQLSANESFSQGIVRHYREEMGITVEVFEDIYKPYEIREPNKPLIPGMKYLCKHVEGEPNSPNHSDFKWVALDEFEQIPESKFVPDQKEYFTEFIKRYQAI